MPILRLILAVWLAAFSALRAAPVLETLAAFERPPQSPASRMIFVPAAGAYFGTTTSGGTHDQGTVFRMMPDGAIATLVSFSGGSGVARGEAPDASLALGSDGQLYGATVAGGAGGFGTIFRVTTAGVAQTLVDFTGLVAPARGSAPNGLTLAADGFFYGTTNAGGTGNLGTVFKLTVNSALGTATVATLVEFTGGPATARRGAGPVGALVASGATLYGATQLGGTTATNGEPGFGTIFKVSTTGTSWATLVDFTGTVGAKPGAWPAAGLVLHPDGRLYGTTEFGGADDFGTLFVITTAGAFTAMHDFDDALGSQPAGALAVGPAPALLLYGTTSGGGENGVGTIFTITPVDALLPTVFDFEKVVDFSDGEPPAVGGVPRAGLGLAAGAGFVGTTGAGGAGEAGTVFFLSAAGAFSHVANFTNAVGWEPAGGVAFDSAGDWLVPLREGGASGAGTIVRAPGTVEVVFGGTAGEQPAGALTRLGADFFGATEDGGASGRGAYFRHTPGVGLVTLGAANTSSGATPEGPLADGRDGFLYGVAREGGASGKGAIVRITPGGGRVALVSFTGVSGAARGERPRAPLALGEDGNFYGVTERGGAAGLGTAFVMTPAGTLTTLHDFAAAPAPHTPSGGLVRGPDGNLFGPAFGGGLGGGGAIFRLTPAGALTTLVEFTAANGRPEGALTAALDGTLYGTTTGASGAIFRLSPEGVFLPLFVFTGSTGEAPKGELAFGLDGRLHGTTRAGGALGGGTIFRLAGLGPHAGTGAAAISAQTTLHGSAQSGGEPTSGTFEYGTTPALGALANLSTTTTNTLTGTMDFTTTLAGLTPGTTYYYRAKATNPSGTSNGLVRSFVALAPLAGWKSATLGDANAPDTGDPDGDGLLTLAEYGLLRDPAASDPAGLPSPVVRTFPDGARLSLTLPRDPARSDVTIEVLASGEVAGPWTIVAASTLGAPFAGPGYVSGDSATPGIKTVLIRDTVPAANAVRRFLRVRVWH